MLTAVSARTRWTIGGTGRQYTAFQVSSQVSGKVWIEWVAPGWSPAILATFLGNCFPVVAVLGDRSLMLKWLDLITSGYDVGPNSVGNLRPAVIPDHPGLDGP
jgi:hypothetical protein